MSQEKKIPPPCSRIADALPGERFYFPENRGTVFTLISYITRRSGLIYACRIKEDGKLQGIYISAYREVIILNKKDTENAV